MRRGGRLLGAIGVVGALCAGMLVAVPADANPRDARPKSAEPVVEQLVAPGIRDQVLSWHPCSFPDLDPQLEAQLVSLPGLACATVTVPRDWDNARDGHTITVEISRMKSSSAAQRRGVMMINPGGPGASGLAWGPVIQLRSPDIAAGYDTIGFDPRGVGQSTPLECEYDNSGNTQAERAENFADGCLANPLTRYITTKQTAMDMDFIRFLLGEPKISYLGYSYGTWLGSWYAATFPSRTDRFVLDSSTDMSTGTLESTWDLQPGTRDRQFQDMLLPYMARNDATYHLGTDPIEIRRKFEASGGFDNYINLLFGFQTVIGALYDTTLYPDAAAMVAAMSQYSDNDRQDFRQPYSDQARRALPAKVDRMRHAVAEVGVSEAVRSRVLNSIDEGVDRYALNRAVANQTANQAQSRATKSGAMDAIRCQDGQWTTDIAVWEEKLTYSFTHAPLTGMANVIPSCAFWPAQENGFPDLRNNRLPAVLFIQSEFDPATAYEGAAHSVRKFKSSKAVLINNEGSHGNFPYGTRCVDATALSWLLDGQLPSSKWTACGAVPLPGEKVTYEVGGRVNRNGQLRGFKMESKSVRQANRIVAEFRRQAGIPDVPSGDVEVMAAALPIS
ncbi:alpha/beta fold hydrolase [Microlunatus panaciterrae]